MDQHDPTPKPRRRRNKKTLFEAKEEGNNILPNDLTFDGNRVRIVERNGEPWWIAADVCAVLGLTNVSKAVESLEDDERITLTISEGNRGNPNVLAIDESGLYSLIMRSRKPQAKSFRRWVTRDVLPSIRKTGRYVAPEANEFRKMIAAFIPGELRPWESTFPEEFFQEICRLNGWKYNASNHRTTGSMGHVIREIVYERLPTGVLEKLDEINPPKPGTGRRTRRHHQLLARDVIEFLKERLRVLVAMAKVEATWHDFKARVDATYPKPGRQMILPGSLGLPPRTA